MFLIRNLVSASATILDMVLGFYMLLIFGRVIISWVNADPYNPIVQFLYQATEPVLQPIRRRMGIYGGVDFSPMILLLIVVFLRGFLVTSLFDLASRL
ncbi:MAG TPA: YggT family protein [Acidobacteriota bacterium]|nr:YggT family protein [Acidobacteriota bacterium]